MGSHMHILIWAAIIVGGLVMLAVFTGLLLRKFYIKVNQGEVLIVNNLDNDPVVTFTGALVLPIIHRAEVMDISLKTIEVARRGPDGLICADNIRADIQVTFFVKINKTRDDVLHVAQAVGCARASQIETVRDLFSAKFSEALKTVGKRLDFIDLYEKRDSFRDQIIEVIGEHLNGYVLEDAAIDYLEQTPMNELGRDNITDAEGIRKITELTTAQNVRTNELVQRERMEVGRQNLVSDEAIFQYDKQRAEARARADKETRVAQTREKEEADRFALDQAKSTSLTRQAAEEEIQKREVDKQRNIEVANKQRERVVVIETVEVKKAEDLKEIEREREVEILRIAKEKELERERKEIAEVIRGRVAVDKTVAEEEERIKELRIVSDAKRQHDVAVIQAEAVAQSALIEQTKRAEGEHEVAKVHAKNMVLDAEAQMEAADKAARAKIRMAEGELAEKAASGLAEVRVKEAGALAIEKEGLAMAKVTRERMLAEAEGIEQQGMAKAKVDDVNADVTEKLGRAQAVAMREKLSAEAAGLTEKAAAMRELDESSRRHEEFRIELDMQREIEVQRIKARTDIAHAQAEVLGQALADAKFQIVGGDGAFFDRFVSAISLGNAIDGFAEQSKLGSRLVGDYMDGSASMRQDLMQVLSNPRLDLRDIKDLSGAALLGRLASLADGDTKRRLEEVIEALPSTDR